MLHKLFTDKVIYSFSRHNRPALKVKAGEVVQIHTLDCFANQVRRPEDSLQNIDWEKINPATGPIFIEDAEPGDVLKVTILDIALDTQGVMACGKDLGVLGDSIYGLTSKLITIKDERAIFDEKLSLPLNPMIGVIGVAPALDSINCGTPGSHGGNMDNSMITKGAVLYLPIYVEGALFALGDLHAAMGDGEIGVTGVETNGSVTVKLEVVKELKLSNPILENEEFLSTIASSLTLDDAVTTCTRDMADLLNNRLDLLFTDITMLMSIAGSTQICQVVDPLKTARFLISKKVLLSYDFKL